MKLSVISPTYNESENVGLLIAELEKILAGTDYEILISDDNSPDLTWARVEEIGRHNPRVRVLRRTSNRGLGPSVVDGFNAATGEAVACIDADLQHDPAVLPRMLNELMNGSNLVVATRYMPGGGTANWGIIRRFGSWGCTKLAQWLLGVKLRDPMSGYFMMLRGDFLKVRVKELDKLTIDVSSIFFVTRRRVTPRRCASDLQQHEGVQTEVRTPLYSKPVPKQPH